MRKKNFKIKKELSDGCGICVKMLPDVYEIDGQTVRVNKKGMNPANKKIIIKTIEKCPTKAIVFNERR